MLNIQGDFKKASDILLLLEPLDPSIPIVFHRYDAGCFDPLSNDPSGKIDWVRNFYKAHYLQRTIEVLSGYFDDKPNYRLAESLSLEKLANSFTEFMLIHYRQANDSEIPFYKPLPPPPELHLAHLESLSAAVFNNKLKI